MEVEVEYNQIIGMALFVSFQSEIGVGTVTN